MIKIQDDIMALKDEIISIRRDLHKCPEKGFQEYQTSRYIKRKLNDYGIHEIYESATTGIIAVIKGTVGKSAIGFRADMDALPIEEGTESLYQSENKGYMHACGHDGHMAALLGFAKYAMQNSNQIKKDLVLIFQPAEEGPGGAEIMVKEGIMQKYHIEKVIGMHIFPEYPENKVASKAGPMMARNGEIDLKFIGKPAHGAMPQKGRDAILATANFITSAQQIISRNIDPMEKAVFTIGTIHGGYAGNVVAEEVKIRGTFRAFSDEVYNILVNRIVECVKGIELLSGCQAELSFHHMYRIVNNDDYLYDVLKNTAGLDNFIEAKAAMISEDFSFFQQEVPGLFFFLGSYNEDQGFIHPLHSGKFNFNEEILLTAVQVYWNMLKETS